VKAPRLGQRRTAGAHRVLVELSTGAEAPPTELRLFRAGDNESMKGSFLFDTKSAKSVIDAIAERFPAADRPIPLDYNHGSTDDLGMLNPEMSGKAAGWCSLEVRNGELWAVDISWTEAAAAAISAKEWRFISPTFGIDKDKRVTEILAVALTNTPALFDLEPLVAASAMESSMSGWVPMCLGRCISTDSLVCQACPSKVLCASLCYGSPVPPDPAGEESLSAEKFQASARESGASWEKRVTDQALVATKKEQHRMDKIHLSALGLPDAASDAEGLAAITQLRTQLSAARTEKDQVAGELVALRTKLNEIEQATARREVEELVAAAVQAGKITPASAEAYKSLSAVQLRAIFEKTPVVQRTEPTPEPGDQGGTVVALNAAEKDGMRLVTGITAEAYLAHKKKLSESGELRVRG
jgi:phage I-like protein